MPDWVGLMRSLGMAKQTVGLWAVLRDQIAGCMGQLFTFLEERHKQGWFFLFQCLCAKKAKVADHQLSQVSVPSRVSVSPGPWEQRCLQDQALSSWSTRCLALLSIGAWKVGFLSDARHHLWEEYSLHLWAIFSQGDFHVPLMFKKFS